MDQIIKIKPGFEYNSYNTFDAAIGAAKKSREKIKEECSLINGVIVTEYQFNGSECVVSFENNRHLLVSPGKSSIKWEIIETKPNIGKLVNKEIKLELSSGLQINWNWKEVLDKFVGKKAAISPGDQLLFIWSEDRVEHVFDFCVDRNNSSNKYLTIGEA